MMLMFCASSLRLMSEEQIALALDIIVDTTVVLCVVR